MVWSAGWVGHCEHEVLLGVVGISHGAGEERCEERWRLRRYPWESSFQTIQVRIVKE
jgi:hypothetical protein